jgi:hypothetical protein
VAENRIAAPRIREHRTRRTNDGAQIFRGHADVTAVPIAITAAPSVFLINENELSAVLAGI